MRDIEPSTQSTGWFAIRTKDDFKAENILRSYCAEVFFPKETVKTSGKRSRTRAIIPHVLFIKTSRERAIELEEASRRLSGIPFSFWIYRYPDDKEIRQIPDKSIELVKLLTIKDSECEIFNKNDFKRNDKVRIVDGIFRGYEGYVQRVKKNLHVVVEITGVCAIMLPFIHPDLLEKIE